MSNLPPTTTVTRKKISQTVETGFKCSNCNTETVTFDGFAPLFCLNCNTPDPVQVWQTTIQNNIITEVTTPMPIAPKRPVSV